MSSLVTIELMSYVRTHSNSQTCSIEITNGKLSGKINLFPFRVFDVFTHRFAKECENATDQLVQRQGQSSLSRIMGLATRPKRILVTGA